MHWRDVASDQFETLTLFLNDVRFKAPMITIWVASFGSSIHDPVTTYFYLELGATAEQIGFIGSIATIGSLVLAPVYGYIQDNHNAFPAMCLSCFFCATGCLIRGFAKSVPVLYVGALVLGLGVNLWPLVLSHVASCVPPSKRAMVVSAYLGQEKALRLLGRAMYPGVNWMLVAIIGIHDTLIRYRIVMSVCTAFCFFGFVLFLKDHDKISQQKVNRTGVSMPQQQEAASQRESSKLKVMNSSIETNDDDTQQSHKLQRQEQQQNLIGSESWWSRNQASKWLIPSGCLAMALVAQSCASTMGSVLWPIYLKDTFDVGPSLYAWLVFSKALCSIIAVWVFPAMERVLGRYVVPRIVLLAATFACFAGFLDQPFFFLLGRTVSRTGIYGTSVNTSVALIPDSQLDFGRMGTQVLFFAMAALVEPSLKSLATLAIPLNLQGRSWASLTMLQSVGGIIGYSWGTHLYTLATHESTSAMSPFNAIGIMLIIAAVLVSLAECFARSNGCPTASVQQTSRVSLDSEVKGRRHL